MYSNAGDTAVHRFGESAVPLGFRKTNGWTIAHRRSSGGGSGNVLGLKRLPRVSRNTPGERKWPKVLPGSACGPSDLGFSQFLQRRFQKVV